MWGSFAHRINRLHKAKNIHPRQSRSTENRNPFFFSEYISNPNHTERKLMRIRKLFISKVFIANGIKIKEIDENTSNKSKEKIEKFL